ncbi:MAG: phosphate ABC transporter substrate-binding protein PstS [Candidatus Schekmanbacteria bacterium]|nr:phosphate ABC transporter substrate-binding protein PstS [Candidatus Schekmanbacteria bacterium]
MKRITTSFIVMLILTVCIFPLQAQADDGTILGAGATFPYPLYSKMFDVYNKKYGTRINYQSIGSGGGVKQILSRTVDFGASDAFMSDDELKQAPDKLVHIPTCLGAVVITYNLSGSPVLNMTPDIIADIFLGKLSKWNDARIAAINPGVKLPPTNIVVIHRSDGSGTSAIFTDYLSKVSKEWKDKVGAGKSVNWPTGMGAKGNEGVAGLIKQIPGSLGYAELIYTRQNKMPAANVKNKVGVFITPSLESTSAAANVTIPDDTRVSITDTDAKDGYPISGFTWILVYREQNYSSRQLKKADDVAKLLWWIAHEGQNYTKPLDYSPLPKAAAEKAEKAIKGITYNGNSLIK